MCRTIYVTLLILAVSGPVWADPVIFSQPPRPFGEVTVGVTPGFSGALSVNFLQDPAPGELARSYDNFAIHNVAYYDVTDLHFWGNYSQAFSLDPADILSATDFVISFWSDAGGAPGSLLKQLTVAATETFLGNVLGGPEGDFAAYQFDVDFSSNPFRGLGGVTYWLSIVAQLDGDSLFANNAFDWRFSAAGDGVSMQDFDDDDFVVTLGENRLSSPLHYGPTDFAFELTGQVVIPEPASVLVWLVVGAAGLGMAWKRRRHLAGQGLPE